MNRLIFLLLLIPLLAKGSAKIVDADVSSVAAIQLSKLHTCTNNGVGYFNASGVFTCGSVLQWSGSNLGVGAAGSFPIDAYSNSSGTPQIRAYGDGGYGGFLTIENTLTGHFRNQIFFKGDGGSNLWNIVVDPSFSNINDFAIMDAFDGLTPFYIQNGTGLVGINTTSPTTQLQVKGTFSVSGSSTFSNYGAGVTRFNAAGNVNSAEISGDCTTFGSNAITCLKTNGTAFTSVATANLGSGLQIAGGVISTVNNGTVTSVGFSDSSANPIYSVSGSPVTSSGTIAITLHSQSINSFFAGPSTGSSAQPTWRSIVGADLPPPTASILGGVESYASVAHQWINSVSTAGVFSSTQPAFPDISGTATVAQTTIANQSLIACNTARTVDWSTANAFSVSLTAADTCAITFSNASSGQNITIDYFQPVGGTASVSYSTTVKWPAGTAPTMTEGAFATDTCTFKYNGSDYRGSCLQNFQ